MQYNLNPNLDLNDSRTSALNNYTLLASGCTTLMQVNVDFQSSNHYRLGQHSNSQEWSSRNGPHSSLTDHHYTPLHVCHSQSSLLDIWSQTGLGSNSSPALHKCWCWMNGFTSTWLSSQQSPTCRDGRI